MATVTPSQPKAAQKSIFSFFKKGPAATPKETLVAENKEVIVTTVTPAPETSICMETKKGNEMKRCLTLSESNKKVLSKPPKVPHSKKTVNSALKSVQKKVSIITTSPSPRISEANVSEGNELSDRMGINDTTPSTPMNVLESKEKQQQQELDDDEEVIVVDGSSPPQRSRRVSFCLPAEESAVKKVGVAEVAAVAAVAGVEATSSATTDVVVNHSESSAEVVADTPAAELLESNQSESDDVEFVEHKSAANEETQVDDSAGTLAATTATTTAEDATTVAEKPAKKPRTRKPKSAVDGAKKDETTTTARASKRAPKASAKSLAAAAAAAADADADAESTEVEVVIVDGAEDGSAASSCSSSSSSSDKKPVKAEKVLPAGVVRRIDLCKKRMDDAAAELVALEACADVCDQNLDIDQGIDELLSLNKSHLNGIDAPAAVEVETSAAGSSSSSSGSIDASATAAPIVPAENTNTDTNGASTAVTSAAVAVAVASVATVEKTLEENVVIAVNAVIARAVQGSSQPLSLLRGHVLNTLATIKTRMHDQEQQQQQREEREKMQADIDGDKEGKQEEQDSIQGENKKNTLREVVTAVVDPLLDPLVIDDKIVKIAARKNLGVIAAKSASTFEDVDPVAVWRWESYSLDHFTTSSAVPIVKQARAFRDRFGSLLKAIAKVIAQVQKSGQALGVDEQDLSGAETAKVTILEEKVAKAIIEVEKAKERRKEVERKRVKDAEERKRRDEATEVKRKEKEEAAAAAAEVKRQQQEKKAQPSESELKKQAELQKQKSMFTSFFKKPVAAATAAAGTTAATAVDVDAVIGVSTSTATAAVATAPSGSQKAAAAVVSLTAASSLKRPRIRICRDGFDDEEFERSLKATMSIGEISRYTRERYRSRRMFPRKQPRGRKILTVTVASIGSAFGPETYSEIKEVSVDNKLRMLKFHEDFRPAYRGTYSKRSRTLNGRNPFQMDHELFNYDYDSEAEWEEGDGEGEDIEVSGDEDEDEEEGNELVYDDFFRQDNDFGSDADSDGEVMAAAAIQRREGMELVGPRFITKATTKQSSSLSDPAAVFAYRFNEKGEQVACSDREKDVVRLRTYCAVVFLPAEMLPALGEELGEEVGKGKVKAAVKPGKPSADLDAELLAKLVKHIHGSKEGVDKLVAAFYAENPNVPKAQITRRIKEIAGKERHPDGHGSMRFVVKPEYLEKVNVELPSVLFTPPRAKRAAPTTTSTTAAAAGATTAAVVAGNPANKARKTSEDATPATCILTSAAAEGLENESSVPDVLATTDVVVSAVDEMEISSSSSSLPTIEAESVESSSSAVPAAAAAVADTQAVTSPVNDSSATAATSTTTVAAPAVEFASPTKQRAVPAAAAVTQKSVVKNKDAAIATTSTSSTSSSSSSMKPATAKKSSAVPAASKNLFMKFFKVADGAHPSSEDGGDKERQEVDDMVVDLTGAAADGEQS